MQSDNTANMFPVAETIVYITEGITLDPGDLIVTGTPSGVGFARKPPVVMRHGESAHGATRSRTRRPDRPIRA